MAKKALIMIEFQNDFLSEKGAMAGAGIWKRAKDSNVVANTKKVLEAARRAGIPIIHSPISFREGYPEVASTPFGLFKGAADANAFKKGTWGAEIVEDLTPKEGEMVLDKRRLCAFCDSELGGLLKNLDVEELIITGFITNWCVEVTGRSAYDRGIKPIFAVDCMEALSDEEQQFAINKIFPVLGDVKKADEIVNEL